MVKLFESFDGRRKSTSAIWLIRVDLWLWGRDNRIPLVTGVTLKNGVVAFEVETSIFLKGRPVFEMLVWNC